MFDKFLCKHINKKTITVGDVVSKIVHYVLISALLVSIFMAVGETYYFIIGSESTLRSEALIGFLVCAVLYMIIATLKILFKLEVAHCPMNKDDERVFGK